MLNTAVKYFVHKNRVQKCKKSKNFPPPARTACHSYFKPKAVVLAHPKFRQQSPPMPQNYSLLTVMLSAIFFCPHLCHWGLFLYHTWKLTGMQLATTWMNHGGLFFFGNGRKRHAATWQQLEAISVCDSMMKQSRQFILGRQQTEETCSNTTTTSCHLLRSVRSWRCIQLTDTHHTQTPNQASPSCCINHPSLHLYFVLITCHRVCSSASNWGGFWTWAWNKGEN